jgi:hypothetical protein
VFFIKDMLVSLSSSSTSITLPIYHWWSYMGATQSPGVGSGVTASDVPIEY